MIIILIFPSISPYLYLVLCYHRLPAHNAPPRKPRLTGAKNPKLDEPIERLVFSASLLSIALFGLGRFYIGFVDFVDRYPVLYFQAFERLLALRSDFGSRYVPRVGFAFLDDFLGWERGGSRWYINLDEINRTRLQNNNKYMDLYGCGRE